MPASCSLSAAGPKSFKNARIPSSEPVYFCGIMPMPTWFVPKMRWFSITFSVFSRMSCGFVCVMMMESPFSSQISRMICGSMSPNAETCKVL